MIRLTIVLGVAAAVGGVLGCSKKGDDHAGLPPATEWNATIGGEKAPALSGGPDEVDPHGMAGEVDPHAGVDMGGGMGMGGMGGEADPHANVDMGGGGMGDMGGGSTGPLGLPAPDPDRPIDPTKFLRGTIAPSKEMMAKIPAGGTIFVSVKAMDPATGEPTGSSLATDRYDATFPIPFDLTAKQQMVDGTPSLDGDVIITAWWDQDGEAMQKSPGDVIGSIKARIPAADLKLTLDRELPR
jgi:hypothetical protein